MNVKFLVNILDVKAHYFYSRTLALIRGFVNGITRDT